MFTKFKNFKTSTQFLGMFVNMKTVHELKKCLGFQQKCSRFQENVQDFEKMFNISKKCSTISKTVHQFK